MLIPIIPTSTNPITQNILVSSLLVYLGIFIIFIVIMCYQKRKRNIPNTQISLVLCVVRYLLISDMSSEL